MTLQLIDWLIIAGYLVLALGIGLVMSRRAGKNIQEYFAAGRALPWWLAGTSMVATTFAADTPLAVTGLTIKDGLAGNWVWWGMAVGGMITVFVYARLWHRSGVLTDVELTELRYGGKPAAFLRGFRALYVAMLINSIIIGWVVGAMSRVLTETIFYGMEPDTWFGQNRDWLIIVALLAVTGIYSVLAGLWGVTLTDFIQFFIAMVGCIALAFYAVSHIGGIEALHAQINELDPSGNKLRFIPDFGAAGAMPLDVFLILLFVIWWASWYPGAEPGGGGYVVQRMASCRSEKDSLLAALWFQVAHYCVRPWPWVIVALAAFVMYPQLHAADDAGVGFPMVIRDTAPAGLVGLMLVTFFAAFMSTISTQINWGASYLVNDVYKRFLVPDMPDKALAGVSRIATLIVLVMGGVVAYLMRNMPVDAAWKFMLALGAGTGSVYMLRWFWWRINAWSEISAMAGSLIYFVFLKLTYGGEGGPLAKDERLLAAVAVLTIFTWVVVTFITQPESQELLTRFYRRARPSGPGWGPIAKLAPDVTSPDNLGRSLLCAALGVGVVFSVLPGVGSLIFGDYMKAGMAFCVTVVCVGVLLTQINAVTRE
jgi:SSS family solute:Na+ symporter